MGMGLDPVTFPGMVPLGGVHILETTKITIFSYKAISDIVFYISASYFLKFYVYQVDM